MTLELTEEQLRGLMPLVARANYHDLGDPPFDSKLGAVFAYVRDIVLEEAAKRIDTAPTSGFADCAEASAFVRAMKGKP